ncbi:hypothetical protein KUTeg_008923, partial [Tegillarca granosa]
MFKDKSPKFGDRIALVQMFVSGTKYLDLKKVETMVGEAVRNGAKLVTLPLSIEYFTCLLDPAIILQSRESIPGPISECMSDLSKRHGIFLAAGSIPEKHYDGNNKIYNACCIFDPKGKMIAQHRKMHLFDIELGDNLNITESSFSFHGKNFTVFDTGAKLLLFAGAFSARKTGPAHWEVLQRARAIDNQTYVGAVSPATDEKQSYIPWGHRLCKVGVGICLDLRYPELARINCQKGASLLLFTGAFSARKTGPAHWEVLQRARAIDNQVYVAAVSPAFDEQKGMQRGDIVLSGNIVAKAAEDEEIIYGDIGKISYYWLPNDNIFSDYRNDHLYVSIKFRVLQDLEYMEEIRRQMPLDNLRRNDLHKSNLKVPLTCLNDKQDAVLVHMYCRNDKQDAVLVHMYCRNDKQDAVLVHMYRLNDQQYAVLIKMFIYISFMTEYLQSLRMPNTYSFSAYFWPQEQDLYRFNTSFKVSSKDEISNKHTTVVYLYQGQIPWLPGTNQKKKY